MIKPNDDLEQIIIDAWCAFGGPQPTTIGEVESIICATGDTLAENIAELTKQRDEAEAALSRPTAANGGGVDEEVGEPVAWEWRACIGGKWGAWLYLNWPVETFRKKSAFNFDNGTYEVRPLYALHPRAEAPAGVVAWPNDGEMLNLLCKSGYDAALVHPHCYRTFSWKTFTEKLKAAIASTPSQAVQADAGRPLAAGTREEIARIIPQHVFMDCSFEECTDIEQKAFLRCADAIRALASAATRTGE